MGPAPKIQASAKINLALHVTGRRDDGYHLLDTLVVFADHGDVLQANPAEQLSLTIDGPYANELNATDDNLVLKAARSLQSLAFGDANKQPGAAIHLIKRLPVASGIGGGSADAAATLLALCDLWEIDPASIGLAGTASQLGADVAMCLHSKPLIASGIGEKIRPVAIPELNLALINPRSGLSTPEVFRSLSHTNSQKLPELSNNISLDGLLGWLQATNNDLQSPAIALVPEIQNALNALADSDGCHFARMSGSGATCFGIFPTIEHAQSAAHDIGQKNPDWWSVASKTTTY